MNVDVNTNGIERLVRIVVDGREIETIFSKDMNESSDLSLGEALGMIVYDNDADFTVYDGVEEQEYSIDDFEMDWEDLENLEEPFPSDIKTQINIEEWVKENGGKRYKIYENKSKAEFEIKLKKGEKFDPSKAAIITIEYISRDLVELMMYKFVYDGKIYDFGLLESDRGNYIGSYNVDEDELNNEEGSDKVWLEDKYYNSDEKNKITLYLYTEGVRIDIRGTEGELIDCEMAIKEDYIQGIDVYINDEEAGIIDQEDLGKPLTMDDDDDPDFDEDYDWGDYWDLYKPKEVFEDAKQLVWEQSKVGAEINIELEEGERFDPKKLRLLVSEMPVPNAEFEVYCGALYNGKIYPIEIDIDSEDVKNEEIIWEDDD